jgi:RimJ/RimL family protein N-acetyltransferase
VAAIALARGCARLEWTVLQWNEPALGFYEKLGAKRLDGWVTHRLEGPLLEAAAAEAIS